MQGRAKGMPIGNQSCCYNFRRFSTISHASRYRLNKSRAAAEVLPLVALESNDPCMQYAAEADEATKAVDNEEFRGAGILSLILLMHAGCVHAQPELRVLPPRAWTHSTWPRYFRYSRHQPVPVRTKGSQGQERSITLSLRQARSNPTWTTWT